MNFIVDMANLVRAPGEPKEFWETGVSATTVNKLFMKTNMNITA